MLTRLAGYRFVDHKAGTGLSPALHASDQYAAYAVVTRPVIQGCPLAHPLRRPATALPALRRLHRGPDSNRASQTVTFPVATLQKLAGRLTRPWPTASHDWVSRYRSRKERLHGPFLEALMRIGLFIKGPVPWVPKTASISVRLGLNQHRPAC
mgnify:FL=1